MTPERYGALAEAIAGEMERLGWWPAGLAPDAPPAEVSGAFGQPSMAFTDWLARVLVPRLREVAAGTADPPGSSRVAAQAIRELDGATEAAALIDLLVQLDTLVEQS